MNITMNSFSRNVAAAALLATACLTSAQAAIIVYEDVDFIKGTDTRSESFTIKQAGSYQVTLSDFRFPKSFTELDLLIGTAASKEFHGDEVGSIKGPGIFTFNAIAGTYWANVLGITDKPLDIGLYGIRIEQMNSVSAVPLPTSILMLGSALVAFVGFGRGGLVSRFRSETHDKPAELFAV